MDADLHESSQFGRVFSAVYGELRILAQRRMAHEQPQTLGPTALVHEAFLRLERERDAPEKWTDKPLLFAAAAQAMRRILVDRARARRSLKRGGALTPTKGSLDSIEAPGSDDMVLTIDEALETLETEDPTGAELIKLKYFVGLQWEDIARIQGVSTRTLRRQWAYARAWLRDFLESKGRETGGPIDSGG